MYLVGWSIGLLSTHMDSFTKSTCLDAIKLPLVQIVYAQVACLFVVHLSYLSVSKTRGRFLAIGTIASYQGIQEDRTGLCI